MKTTPVVALVLLSLLVSSFTFKRVTQFYASFQGVDIRLDWQVEGNDEINEFKIYRKKASESTYSYIYALPYQPSTNYYFMVDDQLYKNDGDAENISYKLEVKHSNGTNTYYTSIEHNPTAVQRSWGSIKAMFK